MDSERHSCFISQHQNWKIGLLDGLERVKECPCRMSLSLILFIPMSPVDFRKYPCPLSILRNVPGDMDISWINSNEKIMQKLHKYLKSMRLIIFLKVKHYKSTRKETALFVFLYNIYLRDAIFSFLYHFYIKVGWYNIFGMESSDMYKHGWSYLKKSQEMCIL